MTGFALKTEIEIFENESRLLILCPNLLHLITYVLLRNILFLIFIYDQSQKVRVFRHCTVNILKCPLPSNEI